MMNRGIFRPGCLRGQGHRPLIPFPCRTYFPCRAVCLLALAVLLTLVVGCSRVRTISDPIYKGDGIRIQLVGQVDKSGNAVPQGNEHPWEVDAKTLDALLGSIQYRKLIVFFKGKPREAFPLEQRAKMLLPLTEALAKAGPDQWVDFSFENRSKWLIVSRDLVTDGVMFRKDGKLNCAFCNLAFEPLGDSSGTAEPYRGSPTEYPVEGDWVLVVGPGQNLKKVEKPGWLGPKEFSNWIQLDLSMQWPSPPPPPAPAGKEEGAGSEKAGSPRTGSVEEKAPTPEEIEQQMRFLDQLREEGAITAEAYEQKKTDLQELLNKSAPAGN